MRCVAGSVRRAGQQHSRFPTDMKETPNQIHTTTLEVLRIVFDIKGPGGPGLGSPHKRDMYKSSEGHKP